MRDAITAQERQLAEDLQLVVDARTRKLTEGENSRLDDLVAKIARLQMDLRQRQEAVAANEQRAARRAQGRRALVTTLNIAEQDEVVARQMVAAVCRFAAEHEAYVTIAKRYLKAGEDKRSAPSAANRAVRYLVRYESLIAQGMMSAAAVERIRLTSRPILSAHALRNYLSRARRARRTRTQSPNAPHSGEIDE